MLNSPPTCVLCGSIGHLILSQLTNDCVKKFAERKIYIAKYSPTKRIYSMLCKISHYDKLRATWRAPRGSKENFAPDDANLSPCVTLYIYIFPFLLSSSKQPADRGLRGMSTKNGREGKKKVEGWSGPGERWSRREKGETLNRCNSFSWTSAKSYIVSGPSILITFSSPFKLYMNVFLSAFSPNAQLFYCLRN